MNLHWLQRPFRCVVPLNFCWMTVLRIRSLSIHLKWPHSRLVTRFWVLYPPHSFLRSSCLTGNQRSAFPGAVSMWCWAAWSGIQSMRFTWWQRISRASLSLASSSSEHPQSPLLSQVLFPSSHPEHPHTSATVHKGFRCDQKGSNQILLTAGSDMNHLCPPGIGPFWLSSWVQLVTCMIQLTYSFM